MSLVSGGLDEETSVGLTVRDLADGRLLHDVELGATPVRAHEAAVVAAGDTVYVATLTSLLALDLEDASLRWELAHSDPDLRP